MAGRGSFLNSGSLKEFAREMVNRGYRDFVFDLQDCVMMDSTFMGTMAGMALRLKELGQGRVHVIHCGERSRSCSRDWGSIKFSIFKPTARPRPDARR